MHSCRVFLFFRDSLVSYPEQYAWQLMQSACIIYSLKAYISWVLLYKSVLLFYNMKAAILCMNTFFYLSKRSRIFSNIFQVSGWYALPSHTKGNRTTNYILSHSSSHNINQYKNTIGGDLFDFHFCTCLQQVSSW